jgi:hypothetical protein
MCRFVPGQAIAIGPLTELNELNHGLPGEVEVQPLVTGELNHDMAKIGRALLRTQPGLEVFAVSQMSARLSSAIKRKAALVDLNHILPYGMGEPLSEVRARLSPHAQKEAHIVRNILRRSLPRGRRRMHVAILDSGLTPEYSAHRSVEYFDYSRGGRYSANEARADPLGHGTKVVKILDDILPPEIELVVGRLPSDENALTTLTAAHALGDLIARTTPEVVNLSFTIRTDVFFCRVCREQIPAPALLNSLLSLVIRVGGRSAEKTVTVMASGNTGQIPNSRWLTNDIETLIFAVAENKRGERTKYSSAPEGPDADMVSAGAFGGDDPDETDAQGCFYDGSRGTSFAAPFISAVALLAKHLNLPKGAYPKPLGALVRELISRAREGRNIPYGVRRLPHQ